MPFKLIDSTVMVKVVVKKKKKESSCDQTFCFINKTKISQKREKMGYFYLRASKRKT